MCVFSECSNCSQLSSIKACDDFEKVKNLERHQWKTHNTKAIKTVEIYVITLNNIILKWFLPIIISILNFSVSLQKNLSNQFLIDNEI